MATETFNVQETIEKANKVRQELKLLDGRWDNDNKSVSERMFNNTKEKLNELLNNLVIDFPFASPSIARTISQLKIISEKILPYLEYDSKHGWLALRNIMMLQVDSLLHSMTQDLPQEDVIKDTQSDIADTFDKSSNELMGEILKSVYKDVGENQRDMLKVLKALYKEVEQYGPKVRDHLALALQDLENSKADSTQTSYIIVKIIKEYNNGLNSDTNFIKFLGEKIVEETTIHDVIKTGKIYSNKEVITLLIECGRIRENILRDYPELKNPNYQVSFESATLAKYAGCLTMKVRSNSNNVTIKEYNVNSEGYPKSHSG